MCEEAAIVDKIGTLFLGGPPLVKAALGEEISAEELGGARVHTSVSGVLDYFVENEEESFAVVRDAIATTPYATEGLGRIDDEAVSEPLYTADVLDGEQTANTVCYPNSVILVGSLLSGVIGIQVTNGQLHCYTWEKYLEVICATMLSFFS